MDSGQSSCIYWVLSLSVFLRILGNRVAELEKKLKTLEMSGLWSLPGGYKYLDILKQTYIYIFCTIIYLSYNFLCPSASCYLPEGLTYNVSLGICGSMLFF